MFFHIGIQLVQCLFVSGRGNDLTYLMLIAGRQTSNEPLGFGLGLRIDLVHLGAS